VYEDYASRLMVAFLEIRAGAADADVGGDFSVVID
jgi:hypothetical protein